MSTIATLIVDDDVMCRDALRTALADLPDIRVDGAAPNGKIGLDRARQSAPDLVVLASSLTDVSAVEFTRTVLSELSNTAVLITSKNRAQDADVAIQALEAGAFDFVLKPESRCREDIVAGLRRMLVPKIRCYSIKRYSRIARGYSPVRRPKAAGAASSGGVSNGQVAAARDRVSRRFGDDRIAAVLIGASTGGPEALMELLPGLPAGLPVPVVVVLHMPKLFTKRMAEALDRKSALAVKEAEDEDLLEPGHVYLAPGGQHVILERGTRRRLFVRMDDGPPEGGCKPAVNVLFRSAEKVLGKHVLGVLLTGMGEDGKKGLIEMKNRDAPTLAQDEATSVVWGMPGSAVRAGCVDEILPLERIAQRIQEIVGTGQ